MKQEIKTGFDTIKEMRVSDVIKLEDDILRGIKDEK